jgi:hypothetical protein
LFQCSNASGAFLVEEVFNFSQEDLDPNDVFLLDVFSEVYVWVGDKSTAVEKKMALTTAAEYVKNATDGRSADTPIVLVHAGHEPSLFTSNFLGWNWEVAQSKADPNEAKLRALQGTGTTTVKASSVATGGSSASSPAPVSNGSKHPLAALQHKKDPKDLPSGVEPTRKEEYLQDSDFATVFKVSRDDFVKLPNWKKESLKKAAGLF